MTKMLREGEHSAEAITSRTAATNESQPRQRHTYLQFPNPLRALAQECIAVGQVAEGSCRCEYVDFTDWPKDVRAACGYCRTVDAVEALIRDGVQEQIEVLTAALRDILEIGKRDLSNPKYDGYFKAARAAIAKAVRR